MAVTPLLGLPILAQGNQTARQDFNDAMDILDSAVGLQGIIEVVASENIAQGDLVNFYYLSMTGLRARRAIYTDTASEANNKTVFAVATAAVTSGNTGAFKVTPGFVTKTSHGLTPGNRLWLSDTAGQWTSSRPNAYGTAFIQECGMAVDANTLFFVGRQDWDVPLRRGSVVVDGAGALAQALLRGNDEATHMGLVIVSNLGVEKPSILAASYNDGSGGPAYLPDAAGVGTIAASAWDEANSRFATPEAMLRFIAADDHSAGYFPMKAQLIGSLAEGFGFVLTSPITGRAWPKVEITSNGPQPRGTVGFVRTGGAYALESLAATIDSGSGGGLETMYTITVPADTLAKNGDYIDIRAVFNFSATATAFKQVKLNWDGGSFLDTGGAAPLVATDFVFFAGRVTRIDASTQTLTGQMSAKIGGSVAQDLVYTQSAAALGSSVDVDFICDVTGTGIAAGDVVLAEASVTVFRQGE